MYFMVQDDIEFEGEGEPQIPLAQPAAAASPAFPLRTYYLDRMYAREGLGGRPLACQSPICWEPRNGPTLYRCDDCFCDTLLCLNCLHHVHARLPFHRIRAWTAGQSPFFRSTSLIETGFRLFLGHDGANCPSDYGMPGTRTTLTAVHINGSHEVDTTYCTCRSAESQELQLVNHRIYPATIKEPETGFTFDVLRHFQHVHLASKTSAYDYHQGLMKITNAINPASVPVSCTRPGTSDLLISSGHRIPINTSSLQHGSGECS